MQAAQSHPLATAGVQSAPKFSQSCCASVHLPTIVDRIHKCALRSADSSAHAGRDAHAASRSWYDNLVRQVLQECHPGLLSGPGICAYFTNRHMQGLKRWARAVRLPFNLGARLQQILRACKPAAQRQQQQTSSGNTVSLAVLHAINTHW